MVCHRSHNHGETVSTGRASALVAPVAVGEEAAAALALGRVGSTDTYAESSSMASSGTAWGMAAGTGMAQTCTLVWVLVVVPAWGPVLVGMVLVGRVSGNGTVLVDQVLGMVSVGQVSGNGKVLAGQALGMVSVGQVLGNGTVLAGQVLGTALVDQVSGNDMVDQVSGNGMVLAGQVCGNDMVLAGQVCMVLVGLALGMGLASLAAAIHRRFRSA